MADPSGPTGVEPFGDVAVVASDEQFEIDVDAERWARLAASALQAEGASGELTLTFVDRNEMAALNLEHMGVGGPTDVLSFPLDSLEPETGTGPRLLGDVVVCPAIAADNAPEHAGTFDDEVALLTVHGVLHVVGHDHVDPAETRTMRRRELQLLAEYHWHGPPPPGFNQEHTVS